MGLPLLAAAFVMHGQCEDALQLFLLPTSDIVVIEGKTLTVFLAPIKEIENHIDSVVHLPAVTASSPKWLVVLNQVSTYDVVVRTQH